MIPVFQTRFGDEGNCLAACFASIIEVPLDRLDFSCSDAQEPGAWYSLALSKLKPLGWAYYDVRCGVSPDGHREVSVPPGTYFIASGHTRRSQTRLHAVVVLAEPGGRHRLAHDPHPDGTGIGDAVYVGFLVPLIENQSPATPQPSHKEPPHEEAL